MSTQRFVTRLGTGFAVASVLLHAAPAHAQLVDIQWDANGAFERSLEIAPAKFVEVCAKLVKGQSIAWSFKGQHPLNFNIHYHEGKSVVFPARKDGITALDGVLAVPVDQDYCWMWENKGGTPAPISLTLRRG